MRKKIKRTQNKRVAGRKAEGLPTADQLDSRGDMGAPGDYGTQELPESGHDDAIDDFQQKFASVKALQRIASDVATFDKGLARRLAALSREAEKGIREDSVDGSEMKHSTAPLELPGQEGEAPLDADQNPNNLAFYGTHPPHKSQAGPQHREDVAPGLEDMKTRGASKTAKAKPVKKLSKKNKSIRSASKRSASPVWDSIQKHLSTETNQGGTWGNGEWESRTSLFGKTASLDIQASLVDGTELSPKKVAFTLTKEDPKSKVAYIEVTDGAISNETRVAKVPEAKAQAFAKLWANNAASAAKAQLDN
jgi:hypothetical protein